MRKATRKRHRSSKTWIVKFSITKTYPSMVVQITGRLKVAAPSETGAIKETKRRLLTEFPKWDKGSFSAEEYDGPPDSPVALSWARGVRRTIQSYFPDRGRVG